jgi:hypothetical protein
VRASAALENGPAISHFCRARTRRVDRDEGGMIGEELAAAAAVPPATKLISMP